jgi:acyl-CoA synthetase (AMP-forming)/AMP-acid ligase II/acyl carrier protein
MFMQLDQETCLDDLLAARAARFGSAVAIVGLQYPPLTYQRLYQQVVEVVTSLNRLGIGRGDRLALVLPNGPLMATAFVSVATGCACAPLNPAFTAEEFDFYLSDLEAKALMTLANWETPARAVARARGIGLIELTPSPEAAGLFTMRGLPQRLSTEPGVADPSDVALVLHTSGTTSRPKMTPLTQANICASAHHVRQTLALTCEDRCLNVMPLFHIHGLIAALLASLAAGGSVFCSPGFDAVHFFEWMQLAHPTWYTAVPTMHQAILAQAPAHREMIASNPLRFIRSSSASMPPSVMAELERVFNAPLIEAYGMTEAAHQMASNPLPPQPRKPGSVGLSAGPQIAIMDDHGKLLPAGTRGEIVIRGPNVMGGYHNNPVANQNAFVDGWFRTGDEGYFDEDGYLYITGRLKEMINRGGEKIAPREVDEAFLEHPAVAQAVTFAVRHASLGEDVSTAVVLHPGANVTPRELRQFVLQRLATHKVPSQVLILDQIPKGPTGKLQRIGLADILAPYMKAAFQMPRNDIERALARLWQETLRLDTISVWDNFFACGGDSLTAVQLIARIRQAFQIELPLGSIFREPTIAEQAALIENLLLDELEALSEQEAERMADEPSEPIP